MLRSIDFDDDALKIRISLSINNRDWRQKLGEEIVCMTITTTTTPITRTTVSSIRVTTHTGSGYGQQFNNQYQNCHNYSNHASNQDYHISGELIESCDGGGKSGRYQNRSGS